MADYLSFDEGEDWLLTNDFEAATVFFLLSDLACPADVNSPQAGEHGGGDTLAGGVGEVVYWTGGGRQTQAVPVPSAGVVTFAQETWTASAADGPASVRSIVMVTTADDSGVAIGAWNIEEDGGDVSMTDENDTIEFTPVFFLANVGET